MIKIETLGAKELADCGEAFLVAAGEFEYAKRAAKAHNERKRNNGKAQ